MLPPPPPPKKPKPTQVAVICSLCGTRLHAPLEKIGQTIQCPDCHTKNEVKAEKETAAKKPKGPTLDGVEEIELSETVQRPAYRPLQKPRGEYEILSALDPEAVTHGWTLPDAQRPGAKPAAATPAKAATVAEAPAEDEEEFTIEAPVERLELKPEPIKLPPPDPDEQLYDGKYDDELFGTNVNRKAPGAWKLAPFRVGIVEFLFQPDALFRWILYAMGASVLVALANLTAEQLTGAANPLQEAIANLLTIFLAVVFGFAFTLWVAPFGACCLAIVEDTANGHEQVTSWPDYNIVDWFLKAAYFVVAAIAAGIPGAVVGSFVASTGLPIIVIGLAVLASWVALFPLVLCSMLAEGSVWAVYSPQTVRSLKAASDAWMMFYLFTMLLGLLGALAMSVATAKMFLISSVGATAMVVLVFVFCRLMGRMLWVAQDKLAKLPAEEEE